MTADRERHGAGETPIFDRFASFYSGGPYPRYSQRMAELLPAVLRRLGASPRRLLDLACGEGTFAVAATKQGFDVTGLDASERMLELASRRVAEEGLRAKLVHGDMRALGFRDEFDLVTCWYDSLNYMLERADLQAVFSGVARALAPGGLFLFDMNTIFGLAVMWRSQPCSVVQDAPGVVDIHINSFDFETDIATKRIVVFTGDGDAWKRIDEVHRERGYRLEEIAECLARAGLRETARWGSLQEMTEPGPETGRVWFAAARPGR